MKAFEVAVYSYLIKIILKLNKQWHLFKFENCNENGPHCTLFKTLEFYRSIIVETSIWTRKVIEKVCIKNLFGT